MLVRATSLAEFDCGFSIRSPGLSLPVMEPIQDLTMDAYIKRPMRALCLTTAALVLGASASFGTVQAAQRTISGTPSHPSTTGGPLQPTPKELIIRSSVHPASAKSLAKEARLSADHVYHPFAPVPKGLIHINSQRCVGLRTDPSLLCGISLAVVGPQVR